jgi:hypothetical protein
MAFGCGGESASVAAAEPSAASPPASVPSGTSPDAAVTAAAASEPAATSSSTPAGTGSGQAAGVRTANAVTAGPSNYLSVLRSLKPGDTLLLAPGTYDDPASVPGLPVFDLNGTLERPIVITGPDAGPRPLFMGRATHNTVRLSNASHVVIRNLDIDGRNLGGAGVAAQGRAHHVTIEGLTIRGVGGDQQHVGISTVGQPTWNWTIRRNVIIGPGTGIYLGNSDGTSPFVAGLVENNLVRDAIGYAMQIKHQLVRPSVAGMPTTRSATVIRHNVFAKSGNSSTGSLARPNLLVGHFPPSGPGADDVYLIHGNFLHQNPSEALFQGEGNIAFFANVLLNDAGSAVSIVPHNDVPKTVRVFGNTIVARGTGVTVRGGAPGTTQRVFFNAVFAGTPLSGGEQSENVVDAYGAATNFLVSPGAPIGTLDLHPRAGALRGPPIDPGDLTGWIGSDRDFNGAPREWIRRGAYTTDGANPGWRLALEVRP